MVMEITMNRTSVDTANLRVLTLMTPGARLWTLDKRLVDLAGRFGVAYHSKAR